MRLKTLLITSAFTLSLLTSTALAASISDFADVQGHWAYDTIEIMVDKGIMNGVSDTSFAPNDTISYGEVLAIATRLVAPEYIEIGKYLDTYIYAEECYHWAMDYYMAAYECGMVDDGPYASLSLYHRSNVFLPDGTLSSVIQETMKASMTREEMAVLLCSMAEVNGETLTELDNIGYAIADYGQIKNTDEVKKVYSAGLITGVDANGTFNPSGTLTRAEATAIFCRLMNYTDRVEVVINAPTDENGTVTTYEPTVSSIDANGVMTIYEGGYRTDSRLAQAGDIFVKLDGTSIVLVTDPITGVLAAGQGVAADEGFYVMTNMGRDYIAHDSQVYEMSMTDSLGNKLQNTYYWINSLTGEGHWAHEWDAVTSQPAVTGTEFNYQLSEDMNWCYSVTVGIWIPVYSNDQADFLINNIISANGLS